MPPKDWESKKWRALLRSKINGVGTENGRSDGEDEPEYVLCFCSSECPAKTKSRLLAAFCIYLFMTKYHCIYKVKNRVCLGTIICFPLMPLLRFRISDLQCRSLSCRLTGRKSGIRRIRRLPGCCKGCVFLLS